MEAYKYTNHDVCGQYQQATMYVRNGHMGHIKYSCGGESTGWHGWFARDLSYNITLSFDCHGTGDLKVVNLWPDGPRTWFGRDYLQRDIQFELL